MSPAKSDLDVMVGCIVTAVLFAGITVFAFGSSYLQCRQQARALGLAWSWGPLQKCIVTRHDGVKVKIENYGRADRE